MADEAKRKKRSAIFSRGFEYVEFVTIRKEFVVNQKRLLKKNNYVTKKDDFAIKKK